MPDDSAPFTINIYAPLAISSLTSGCFNPLLTRLRNVGEKQQLKARILAKVLKENGMFELISSERTLMDGHASLGSLSSTTASNV
jgi:hypothetical protein